MHSNVDLRDWILDLDIGSWVDIGKGGVVGFGDELLFPLILCVSLHSWTMNNTDLHRFVFVTFDTIRVPWFLYLRLDSSGGDEA